MSEHIVSHLDKRLKDMLAEVEVLDVTDPTTINASKAIVELSKARANLLDPDPTTTPVVPTTRWGKIKAAVAPVLDNETTRTLIKAGGSVGGVALVVYAQIHKDHILDRTALGQSNQRNN